MDEFRKPYEYEEDKPVAGFILGFCVMLISSELPIGFTEVFQGANMLHPMPIWHTLYLIFGYAFLFFIGFTCFSFYRLRRFATTIAKIYLVYRFIFLTFATFLIYHFRLLDKNAIGPRISQFKDMDTLIQNCLIIPLIYIIGFSFWYLYFLRSKRVKLYEKNAISQA